MKLPKALRRERLRFSVVVVCAQIILMRALVFVLVGQRLVEAYICLLFGVYAVIVILFWAVDLDRRMRAAKRE